MEADVMKALLEAFEQSDWQEMTVTIGNDRLYVSRLPGATADGALEPPGPGPEANVSPPAPGASGSAPAAAGPTSGATVPPTGGNGGSAPGAESTRSASEPEATSPAVVTSTQPNGLEVTSPSVGLFWRAPAPGADPFVEVSGRVAAGDTLAIVEVMKLMNHVTAPEAGVVTAILPENGAAVEFGQTLVVIDPEA